MMLLWYIDNVPRWIRFPLLAVILLVLLAIGNYVFGVIGQWLVLLVGFLLVYLSWKEIE